MFFSRKPPPRAQRELVEQIDELTLRMARLERTVRDLAELQEITQSALKRLTARVGMADTRARRRQNGHDLDDGSAPADEAERNDLLRRLEVKHGLRKE